MYNEISTICIAMYTYMTYKDVIDKILYDPDAVMASAVICYARARFRVKRTISIRLMITGLLFTSRALRRRNRAADCIHVACCWPELTIFTSLAASRRIMFIAYLVFVLITVNIFVFLFLRLRCAHTLIGKCYSACLYRTDNLASPFTFSCFLK